MHAHHTHQENLRRAKETSKASYTVHHSGKFRTPAL